MSDTPKFSVLIPVFNEERILESSIHRLSEYLSIHLPGSEIIIIDNGSTDRTSEIAKILSACLPSITFLQIPSRGPGNAIKEGIKAAKGDYIVTLDADLSSDLLFIDYVKDLSRHADLIIGCKTMGNQRRTLFRLIASHLYITFAQWLFDLSISDYSIGVKAFRRSLVFPYVEHLDPWTGYILELVLICRKNGGRILQIGIDCEDKRESRFNLLYEGFYRAWHLLKIKGKLKDIQKILAV